MSERLRLKGKLNIPEEAKALAGRGAKGEVELDWAAVEDATPEFVTALLGGAPLAEAPDWIGLSTIPDKLAERLLAERPPEDAPPPSRGKRKKRAPTPAAMPAVWRAPTPGPRPAVVAAPRLAPLEAAKLRETLEQKIVADLLGPAGGPTEVVEEPRIGDRYLLGLLAPSRLRVRVGRAQSDAVGAGADDSAEDGSSDDAALSADTMFPSSVGLSFCIEADSPVRIDAGWGRYRRVKRQPTNDTDETVWVWQREPLGGSKELTFGEGDIGPYTMDEREPGVVVRGRARKRADGKLLVSLFLLNAQDEPEEKRDEAWVFQPELSVSCLAGARLVAGDADAATGREDKDEQLSRMAYRKRAQFAVGHNSGVSWEVDASDPTRATRAFTRIVPVGEVAVMSPRVPPSPNEKAGPHVDEKLAGLCLDMKAFAEADQSALRGMLEPLLGAYDAWISTQKKRVDAAEERLVPHRAAAKEAHRGWEQAKGRIAAGIELVATDERASEAFRFANRAMWLQRVHGALAAKRRRGETALFDDVDEPKNRTWRTFQLAFLLLTLPGLADLHHPDRAHTDDAVADLLWFPTGGGKTEAYLGVAAFAMGIRRLQGVVEGRSGEEGVTVLMRYTLRLLTLQQFQRATSLICAMEDIRRADESKWGRAPFRIGLWVGGRSTPNKTAHSEESLRRERSTGAAPMGAIGGMGSPVQLKSCPWCGETIDPSRDMRVESYQKGRGRTLIFCGDRRGECLFSERRSPEEGLPVLVVDEEIYRKLPALLIATVDKFAQMPWKGPVGMLFGQVNAKCDRHGFRSPDLEDSDTHPKKDRFPPAKSHAHAPLRPPDLVIQDELHLISGPLGTLTALYETAVDELSSWTVGGKTIRPKVIASTATVRRAQEQVHGLFLRDVRVFPPPGLDAGDNFFAVERPTEDVPGRRYLGICAPGRRLKLALIRVYSAAMASAQSIFDNHGRHADPWMTLVGYFGSLRELGGMRRLVDDDVASRLRRINARGLSNRRIGISGVRELTSRLGSTEIPSLLEELDLPFDPSPPEGKRKYPIDVLLATNMISVGVDVPRLGLMVCAGQPKTTAEYIQATSRVGRESPGLVLTVYNWARPRDMSHYERFEHYHETFYRHVEANSVTPFSPRALDRGLAGVLVSLVRHGAIKNSENASAQQISDRDPAVRKAIARIARRAGVVEGAAQVEATVQSRLESLLHRWRDTASGLVGGAKLGYAAAKDGITIGLLEHAGRGRWETFTCLDSLRDVEPPVALVLDDGSLDPPKPQGGAT